jgi:hypothetical protein
MTIVKKVYDYFFAPTDPVDLGVSRFLFFGIIFLLFVREPFTLWGKIPISYYQLEPNPIFDYFDIPVFSPEIMGILGYIWLTSLFFSSIGLFTRVSTILAFFTGAYLVGITKSFGHPPHVMFLAMIIFGILAVSYCGDAFSADGILRRKGWLSPVKSGRYADGEYRWPIRLIWVVVALAFCAAGVSKIRNSGIDWITSHFLESLLISYGFTGGRVLPPFDWLPFWVASRPYLHLSMAVITIILEVGAPLALFHPYLRIVLLPPLFFMMMGFWFLMGLPFPDMIATFVFWVPWGKISAGLHLRQSFA